MTDKKGRESLLEFFKFKETECHYFEELESSFWDSENIMTKKYKAIKEKLKEENIESLEKAYKILMNSKTRQKYCQFLMYQYTLSQPINMNILIEKYYSIIYPFYLFLLKSEKEDNKYIILDNINFSVNIYEKNGLKKSFEVDTIEDLQLKDNDNCLKIKIIKNKNEIILSPQIEEHLHLMYALIIFMGLIKKKKDNWKKDQSKVNEINQNLVKETIKTIFDANKYLNQKINDFKLLILSNDNFVPKGIKYSTYVEDKNSSIQNKYLTIGNSYIYLFKDDEMKEILNIIPLIPGTTMFEFNEREKNIKITLGNKEYNLFFNRTEFYNNVLKVVMNISEGEDELFEEEDINKVSEFLYNDKIMGGDLKNTPLFCKSEKDLALLEIKIENLTRAKINTEERGIIYNIINTKNKKEENNDEIKKNNIIEIVEKQEEVIEKDIEKEEIDKEKEIEKGIEKENKNEEKEEEKEKEKQEEKKEEESNIIEKKEEENNVRLNNEIIEEK